MNYMFEAFGGLMPHIDNDAAIKFSLSVILLDHRLEELSSVLTDSHAIGGMEGEPGWLIERRDKGEGADIPYYENWPKNADFHVHVDPDSYQLAYPDLYLERSSFQNYVRRGVEKYALENPERSDIVQRILLQIGVSKC